MSGPDRSPARPGRLRRAARRTAVVAAVLVVALTAASVVYNGFTGTPQPEPTGLVFVRTGDLQTRVVSWGTSGSPVVLVPGAAETATTWDGVARRLAADHRVFAYDVVGWGYSQRRGPYDLDHATRQLLALLDALHLERPVLVGHSSGVAVVAEAALRAPRRVGGLVLLDGDALDTGAGAPTAARHLVLPPYRTTVLRLVVGSDTVVRGIYSRQCGPRCPALDASGIDAWRRPFRVAGAEDALWSMLGSGVLGMSPSRLSGVAAVDVPKAVVFGAHDDVFPPGTPEQTARRIGAPAPQLIPDARHLTLVSDPDAVARAVMTVAGSLPQNG